MKCRVLQLWRWTRAALTSAALPMLVTAMVLPLLLRSMALDGFFGGDPGVRFTAALEAAEHPSRPFEVDAPMVEGVVEPAFLEWHFAVHATHAHAVVPPLFPLATAPFVAWLGMAGAYVVPAVSLVLLVAVMVALARRLGIAGPPALAGWTTVLLSPLVFYALECWEHVPAVLCIATAWLLTCPDGQRQTRPLAAGLAMAGAILLRPEAAWSGLALGVGLLAQPARRRDAFVFAAFASLPLAPITLAHAVHFGSPWGPHLTVNAELTQADWLDSRLRIAQAWLATWEGRDSLWAAFPAAVLAFAAPPSTPPTRTLWLLVLVPLAGAILTAPNAGGAQWGPRYLLGTVPPLLLLAQHGACGLLARPRPVRWVAAMATVVVIAAGLVTTRTAFKTMQGSKRLHARIAQAIASPPHAYVVTDLWWLDQLAASASPRPTFLYVRDRAALDRLIAILDARGVRRFLAVQGEESAEPVWRDGWARGYHLTGERHVAVRNLRLRTFETARR